MINIVPELARTFGLPRQAFSRQDEPEVTSNRSPMQARENGLFDSILRTIFGAPDQDLAPEERQSRARRRNESGQLAQRAASGDVGDSFMEPPAGSSSGFALQDIARLFS